MCILCVQTLISAYYSIYWFLRTAFISGNWQLNPFIFFEQRNVRHCCWLQASMKWQPSAARHANVFLTISPLNLPTEQQNFSCYYNMNTEGDILTFFPPGILMGHLLHPLVELSFYFFQLRNHITTFFLMDRDDVLNLKSFWSNPQGTPYRPLLPRFFSFFTYSSISSLHPSRVRDGWRNLDTQGADDATSQ